MLKNDNIVMISKKLQENKTYIEERLKDCGDIQIRSMRLGELRKADCLMVYIEVATSNMMLEDSALGKMVSHFWEISPEQIQEFVKYNSLGIADVKKLKDMEEVFASVLAGNAVFFIDGFDQAMKISSVGYPRMGVTEAARLKTPLQESLSYRRFPASLHFPEQRAKGTTRKMHIKSHTSFLEILFL